MRLVYHELCYAARMRLGLAAVLVIAPAVAAAEPNDIDLSGLAYRVMQGGMQVGAVGSPLEFRALSSQLGVVLAPHLLTPADTIGFSGFQFSVDYATTTIDSNADYWKRSLVSGAPPAG